MKRYYDANVFVYWLGGHPLYGERARDWIRLAEAQRAFTSSLTPYEVAVILAGLLGKKLKDYRFVEEVLTPINSVAGLKIVPLTWEDYLRALDLVNEGYDLEDALHLSVALRIGAGEIVSNDRDFDRGPLKRVF